MLHVAISAVFSGCFLLLSTAVLIASSDSFPLFVAEPASHYANPGDQITLHCEAQWPLGQNEATIQWLKDGSPVHWTRAAVRKSVLELRIKSEADLGKYQCLARFGDSGSLLSRAAYVMRPPWPAVRVQDTNMTQLSVPLGNVAIIPCGDVVQFALLAGYEFHYDQGNNTISSDEQHFVTSHGNLIMVMKSSRVGQYRCRILGPGRTVIFQKVFELRIQPSEQRSPVRLAHISPANVTVRKDEQVTLECVYHGSPVPSNRWEVYGRDENRPRIIADSDRRLRFGSLHILNASIQDEGRYVCLGDNTGKGMHNVPASRVVNLRVLDRVEEPRLAVASGSTTGRILRVVDASAGERITLTCETSVADSSVTWFLNGNASIVGADRSERNTTLTIWRFSRISHQGMFQCFVHGGVFESRYATVLLRATSSSSTLITERPRNMTIGFGEATIFACSVNSAAFDGAAQVSWLRHDAPVGNCDDSPDSRVCVNALGSANFMLHIYIAQPEDAGKYTCAVELPNKLELADVWLTVELDLQTNGAANEETNQPNQAAAVGRLTTPSNRLTNAKQPTLVDNTRFVTQLSRSAQTSSLSASHKSSAHQRTFTADGGTRANHSNSRNENSSMQTQPDAHAGLANPLKSLTDNPFYLITIIACCVAFFVCIAIVLIAVVRKHKRDSGKPVASPSFSKRIDLVPVSSNAAYNKLSHSEVAQVDNCNFQQCTFVPQLAQVNPYASTAAFQGIEICSDDLLVTGGSNLNLTLGPNVPIYAYAVTNDYGYANTLRAASRPLLYAPNQSTSPDTGDDTCSDDDCLDDVSPSKRVKYSPDVVNDLNVAASEVSFNLESERNTLNRNKLTAVRKYNTVTSHRNASVFHALSNDRSGTSDCDEYSRDPSLFKKLSQLPPSNV